MTTIALILASALVFLAVKFLAAKRDLKRFSAISDVDKYVVDKTNEGAGLAKSIESARTELEELKKKVGLLSDAEELASAGFYKSKYDFENSKIYESKLDDIRERQKQLIRDKRAIVCTTEWTVEGSKAKGKQMTERTIKLGLSAFNVQCDNEILKVRFDNIDRAEEKITKVRETVDKLLEPNRCHVTNEFFKLKIEELFLCYEYVEKAQAEKEEQKALREQAREEEKARREAEKAQADAEKEEKRYATALEKAKEDLGKKSEKDQEELLKRIADLELKYKSAIENKERAKSMAELTRQGHVYIVSNIGSFGENIYKIGMTRRLDPEDRVDELSDASVPFDFDIHAMIKSEDAPSLERKLHEKFHQYRLNKVNERKEFFKVTLDDIQRACSDLHAGELRFALVAEAKEYRQTVAIFNERSAKAS